jgi:hypothetical protein
VEIAVKIRNLFRVIRSISAMKLFIQNRFLLFLLAAAGLFVGLSPVAARAQTVKRTSFPRVGTIKDYPATGLMTGCGNLYFYKAAPAKSDGANYVFLSRGGGDNAWMNLNGRDVRLKQVKSASANTKSRRYDYRYGDLRLTVVFEDFKPRNPDESDHMFKMKIILRKGREVRVVHAVGSADC